MKFLSSGGLGDAWLVFLKILSYKPNDVQWDHLCGHQVHVDPITEIMTLMPNISYGKCHHSPKDKRFEDEFMLTDPDTIRLNTVASEIKHPVVDLDFIKPSFEEDYVVIQPAAGRPDNSFRCFAPHVIGKLAERFQRDDLKVVLLGAKYDGPTYDSINLTAQTSIKTVLDICCGAKHFVGLDGFLAYVSQSFGVPSTVIYHDSQLPNHYLHPTWEKNTDVFVGPQKIVDASRILEKL